MNTELKLRTIKVNPEGANSTFFVTLLIGSCDICD